MHSVCLCRSHRCETDWSASIQMAWSRLREDIHTCDVHVCVPIPSRTLGIIFSRIKHMTFFSFLNLRHNLWNAQHCRFAICNQLCYIIISFHRCNFIVFCDHYGMVCPESQSHLWRPHRHKNVGDQISAKSMIIPYFQIFKVDLLPFYIFKIYKILKILLHCA